MEIEELDSYEEPTNREDDEAERENFLLVLSAYKNYKKDWNYKINKRLNYIETLPENHRALLTEDYTKSLEKIKQYVSENNHVIKSMIKNADLLFNNHSERDRIQEKELEEISKQVDTEKVTIVLKQIVRDWSAGGLEERESCYEPIIETLMEYFNPDDRKIRVLVPGAGLGRLVYEIALRGFYCEGNEFSLFMLIAANFVLNRCTSNNQYEIFPYIHQFTNNLRTDDIFRPIQFPDCSPSKQRPKGQMNMIAGDFVQVYNAKSQIGRWDAIATCFFIDCANNVLEYLEIIHKILKPGGLWINMGPLLYHFSDLENENSIEPSYECLRKIIEKIGFKFLKEQVNVQAKYSQNALSMQQLEYNCVYFVCKKNDE